MVLAGGVCCVMWGVACQVVGGTPGLPAPRSPGGLPPYSNHENHNKHHLVGTHTSTTG